MSSLDKELEVLSSISTVLGEKVSQFFTWWTY
jgi:hypothetical protein